MNPSNALSEIEGSSGDGATAAAAITLVPPLAEETRPAAILRGGARGLDLVVRSRATVEAIAAALTTRLEEAPTFFRGSDVRIRVEDGPLAAGCLARLDAIAVRFELRIVEVGPMRRGQTDTDGVPQANLAAGSAPAAVPGPAPEPRPASAEPAAPETAAAETAAAETAPTSTAPETAAAAADPETAATLAAPALVDPAPEPPGRAPDVLAPFEGARVVVGPIRSGVILEHPGHLVVLGDVNPGAEIRAEGNIVVLGRLRGTAHAGIGREVGFIVALRLEPQQLRICRKVARASDSDTPSAEPEIAHVTGDVMIVERYQGRLPRSLAASI